ncbi:MAG: PIN domain-containing protein, partial [Chloroflexota bacterium]
PIYLDALRPFFEAMDRGEFRAVTSTVTLLEVLVHPFRRGERALAQQYRDVLLGVEGLAMVSLSADIAEEAARLRADLNIRTPDAIQMATALWAGATCLLTNDARLPSLPGLRLLVLDELRTTS